ncbi:MAG: phosphate ABC transporter substrate-binding protein [Deltaproteobacteria bacterium]
MILVLLAASGCNSGSPTSKTASRPVCIAGSTSIQPFAEKLAEIYMHRHPQARIDVQGGGSSVHPSNPLTNITLTEIRRIFSGTTKNWRALGLPPHAIDLITREEGSGTREAFEHLVMGKHEITPAALVQDSNGSVREIVAGDPYSLGYISAGLVNQQVKALAIDGVFPTRKNIKNHTYKLVRRFLLVARARPAGTCNAFQKFVLGSNGQKILESEGLVGIK